MENSYLPYGHFVPTPAMMNQLQSLGISAYHHSWMANSFYGQQAFPLNAYFQGPPVSPTADTSHDMNTGKSRPVSQLLPYVLIFIILPSYVPIPPEKIVKFRERNREHAKNTRLRKKVAMDGMKTKLLELQHESIHLQKMMDERNTANILLAFSSTDSSRRPSYDDLTTLVPENSDDTGSIISGGDIIEHLRSSVRQEIHGQHDDHVPKRIRRDSSFSYSETAEENSVVNMIEMQDEIDALDNELADGGDQMAAAMDEQHHHIFQPIPDSTVNWKTGIVINAQGNERRLSDTEMYQFRKERNRIHAKMTRDRKKLFTTRMQKLITTLEHQNAKLRHRLSEYSSMMIK